MRTRLPFCDFCHHDEELHEFGPDRRTPKQVIGRKYICSDCVNCEKEKTDAT